MDKLVLNVSASVGVACATAESTGLEELIRSADEAMYRRKRERDPHPRRDVPSTPAFVVESRA